MRKYLLFSGHHGDANGGWKDFVLSFDSIKECEVIGNRLGGWWHIVDGVTGLIVKESE